MQTVILMSAKQTTLKKLAYLGAAICEGQPITGVEKGPTLIRQAGTFSMLQKNYGVSVKDYGDIKLENERNLYPKVEHPVRDLNVLGPLLGKLHNKALSIAESKA